MSDAEPLTLRASPGLALWLATQRLSLAFTTYQAGRLFFVGLDDDGRLTYFNRRLPRVMGIAAAGDSLWIATQWQLWRFENALRPGERHEGHDRWYLPRLAHVTGDVDAHDVAIGGDGTPYFVSTLFSCLARPDARYSFVPLWTPSFISRLAPEDRCHLNGLALEHGRPAYVTVVGASDTPDGWRTQRVGGGVVMDVRRDAVVCRGLSMPHSPRLHAGRLWVANAGTGELGVVDLAAGRFEPVIACAGFLRGLALIGDYAVVGLSRPRDGGAFGGLPLADRLAARGVTASCAVQVVDLRHGAVAHELRLDGAIGELYDVLVLPGVRRPGATGLAAEDIRRTVHLPPGPRST